MRVRGKYIEAIAALKVGDRVRFLRDHSPGLRTSAYYHKINTRGFFYQYYERFEDGRWWSYIRRVPKDYKPRVAEVLVPTTDEELAVLKAFRDRIAAELACRLG